MSLKDYTFRGFRHNVGRGQVGEELDVKSKVITSQGSETMDGLVNWKASTTSDDERFLQERNGAKGDKNLKSFDVYLRRKEIRAAAKKTGKKELLTNY